MACSVMQRYCVKSSFPIRDTLMRSDRNYCVRNIRVWNYICQGRIVFGEEVNEMNIYSFDALRPLHA